MTTTTSSRATAATCPWKCNLLGHLFTPPFKLYPYRTHTQERGPCGAVARIEGARSRPHQNLYAPRSATSQSTPRTPTYQLLGLGKGDAGAQCSVKGLPSPDGLGSFRGARRSTRAQDQAWGPTKRRRTAGANNKARSAAASDGAFRGVSMRRRDVVESPLRAH